MDSSSLRCVTIADRSSDHKHCDNGNVIFLIYHMTFHEHMFKGLCEFMGGSLVWRVTTLPCFAATGIGLVQMEI